MENLFIALLVIIALAWLLIIVMRRKRKAWEEREKNRQELAAARQRDMEALQKAMLHASNISAMITPAMIAAHQAVRQAKARAAAFKTDAEMRKQFDALTEENRRRHLAATDLAFHDMALTGTGVIRISEEGTSHIPAAQYRGGGGTFDGGGASGDYTPAASSCDSPSSSSSSSDSSSSCSSSDSGGSSSSD